MTQTDLETAIKKRLPTAYFKIYPCIDSEDARVKPKTTFELLIIDECFNKKDDYAFFTKRLKLNRKQLDFIRFVNIYHPDDLM